MTEHEPQGAPFDDHAFAEALGTRSTSVHDVAYGEGVQYSVGRGDAQLQIYPRTGVTRLTSQALGVRVELFGSAITEVSPGNVGFSRNQPGQDASLTLVPNGGVVFTLVTCGEDAPTAGAEPLPQPAAFGPTPALGGPETPQQAGTDIEANLPSPTVAPPAGPHMARETASRPASERPNGQEGRAAETKPERIQLTGRLGRVPTFRTTTTGSLIGRFPLAVHREDGHTTWHTVLAFGSRAEQLQHRVDSGELIQGREVDIIGYPHVSEWTGKDGKTRRTEQIHAVAVKKR